MVHPPVRPPVASYLCFILYLVAVQAFWEAESREYFPSRENRRIVEKELLVELQDVLDKLQTKRISNWETKLNRVPQCTKGDMCAVKRGPRIGKLCNCPITTTCNYFFLKCL
ncbi:cocaine- and amphetamine-regulated transcript protein-like [Rhinophrynus dorsalis]